MNINRLLSYLAITVLILRLLQGISPRTSIEQEEQLINSSTDTTPNRNTCIIQPLEIEEPETAKEDDKILIGTITASQCMHYIVLLCFILIIIIGGVMISLPEPNNALNAIEQNNTNSNVVMMDMQLFNLTSQIDTNLSRKGIDLEYETHSITNQSSAQLPVDMPILNTNALTSIGNKTTQNTKKEMVYTIQLNDKDTTWKEYIDQTGINNLQIETSKFVFLVKYIPTLDSECSIALYNKQKTEMGPLIVYTFTCQHTLLKQISFLVTESADGHYSIENVQGVQDSN
ncbi:hypothetical protein NEOKW01_1514 [Nematocida sp. AWRm80]|nr:hypothetical protein NEOKW01_1514 [Nematocida sp. AWRm80]